MATVAVTGLHSGENPQAGCGTVRCLRRWDADVEIVGLVYDVLESGVYASPRPDRVFQLPYVSAGREAMVGRLAAIHERLSVDVLLPTLDTEIPLWIEAEEALRTRGIRTLLPSMEAYRARRKQELPTLGAACGCPTPDSTSVWDVAGATVAAERIGYPVVLKGAIAGARDAFTPEQTRDAFHRLVERWGAPVVVQKRIEGTEFDVAAVGDGCGGIPSGCCDIRKTLRSELGKGFGGLTVRNAPLERLAARVVEHLEWAGPLELEFVEDGDSGRFYLIEVNPRLPAWVDFAAACGRNLPAMGVEALLRGQWPSAGTWEAGKVFLRHSVDLVCDVEDVGQLSSAGEIDWRKNS